jgi:hypothetical protein
MLSITVHSGVNTLQEVSHAELGMAEAGLRGLTTRSFTPVSAPANRATSRTMTPSGPAAWPPRCGRGGGATPCSPSETWQRSLPSACPVASTTGRGRAGAPPRGQCWFPWTNQMPWKSVSPMLRKTCGMVESKPRDSPSRRTKISLPTVTSRTPDST